MRKTIWQILCCFVPSRRIRHKLRKRGIDPRFHIHGKNNVVVAVNPDGTETPITKRLRGISIFCDGNNNTIKIHMPLRASKALIKCENDDAYIEIGPAPMHSCNATIHCFAGRGQRCIIGPDTSIVNARIVLNDTAQCIIGRDCLFSREIRIWPTDGHCVLDAETGDVLNKSTTPLIIEDHVWVGEGARITKKAHVYNNSIISGGAVAYKDYKESGVIIAGNPGEIVKRNISWDRANTLYYKKENK